VGTGDFSGSSIGEQGFPSKGVKVLKKRREKTRRYFNQHLDCGFLS